MTAQRINFIYKIPSYALRYKENYVLCCCIVTDILCNRVIVLILESCFIYTIVISALRSTSDVGNSINDPELYNCLKTCIIELH
jgi:hypothetical protein